jgi:hypothetical protein
MRRRKSATGKHLVDRCDNRGAAQTSDIEQFTQQQILRTRQAHIDDLGSTFDSKMERFGKAQRVAVCCLSAAAWLLPTSAQAHQPRPRGDTHDANSISAPGRNDARDAGPMDFFH